MRSQRFLAEQSDRLSRTFERLSSGSRITRASDDAAGLSISDQLRVKNRLYQGAARNIDDATSVVNIISSALDSQKSIIIRLREIAEQGANGTYSDEQRAVLNQEYQTLLAEYSRVAEATSFNSRSLLDQAAGTDPLMIQAGVTGAAEALIAMTNIDSRLFSGFALAARDSDGDGAPDFGDLLTSSQFIATRPTSVDELMRFSQGSLAIQTIEDSNGQSREVYFTFSGAFSSTAVQVLAWSRRADGSFESVGSYAGLPNSAGTIDLTFEDGASASVDFDFSATTFSSVYGADAQALGYFDGTNVQGSGLYAQKSAIGFTGVETTLRSQDALTTLSNKLSELSTSQGLLGAVSARLSLAREVAVVSGEQSKAAQSRVSDVDMAGESADLVRIGILQSASQAVLAQANQQPALALTLLANP